MRVYSSTWDSEEKNDFNNIFYQYILISPKISPVWIPQFKISKRAGIFRDFWSRNWKWLNLMNIFFALNTFILHTFCYHPLARNLRRHSCQDSVGISSCNCDLPNDVISFPGKRVGKYYVKFKAVVSQFCIQNWIFKHITNRLKNSNAKKLISIKSANITVLKMLLYSRSGVDVTIQKAATHRPITIHSA